MNYKSNVLLVRNFRVYFRPVQANTFADLPVVPSVSLSGCGSVCFSGIRSGVRSGCRSGITSALVSVFSA